MSDCNYCGEEEGTQEIINPNFDSDDYWVVCKTCEEVIGLQQGLSMALYLGAEKIASDNQKKLCEIASRTGKPIMSASIVKTKEGYDSVSVTYEGKGE